MTMLIPIGLQELHIVDGVIHVRLNPDQLVAQLRQAGHLNEQPIPAKLDIGQILSDFKSAGWLDQKIETACGYSNGYVAQLRAHRIERIGYENASRLYNLWLGERGGQADVSALTLGTTTG